ncbi:hypothetical protein DMENIID0001_095060 [Sergentomyia squamirostris]
MHNTDRDNQVILIKIKIQVLKLVENIEKLSEFYKKEAITFIVHRISRIQETEVTRSVKSVHSGQVRGYFGSLYQNRLKSSYKVHQLFSWWLSRRNFLQIQQNFRIYSKYLHLSAWQFLHKSVCNSIGEAFPGEDLLEISYHEDSDDSVDNTYFFDTEVERRAEKRPGAAGPGRRLKRRKKKKFPKKEIFNCFHCPKEYKKRQNLIDHYATKHRGFCPDCGEEVGEGVREKLLHNSTQHIDEYPYICDICGESMSRNQQFQIHLESHSKPSKPKVEKKRPEKSLKKEKINRYAVVHPDGAICPVCGIQFPNSSLLNVHKSRKHSRKIYTCEICSMDFTIRASYVRHQKTHCEQQKNFICETCGAKYSTSSGLKDHTMLAHENGSGVSCNVCGKMFKVQRLLTRHLKCHSTERPFACDLCPQTFKIRHHLDRHRKTVHKHILFPGATKKVQEKSVETKKPKNETKATTEELPVKELPDATAESEILQMISEHINPPNAATLPIAEAQPTQCYQEEFPLPNEMIQPYDPQQNYTYPQENYTLPQDAFLPAQNDYNLNPPVNKETFIPAQNNFTLNPQDIIEIPPQTMDNSSFLPYQYNMWDNQFNCQQPINQQPLPVNSQATYNNIGSILTNLELMDNSATFDPTYDFFETSTQQQQQQQPFYSNGQSCPPDSNLLQWQSKIDHYDFNSQNHTLTDISNTFLREEQRQNANITSYMNTASFAGVAGSGINEEQQMFQANNVNVMLPSLADYLQNHFNPFNTTVHDNMEQ